MLILSVYRIITVEHFLDDPIGINTSVMWRDEGQSNSCWLESGFFSL